MARLTAAQQRQQQFAVIQTALHLVFDALAKKYGLGHPLRESCEKIGSGSTPRGGDSVYVSEGVAFIRSLNVRHFNFRNDALVRIPPEIDSTMKGTRVLADDVLLNITGASIGRSCCAPSEVCPANVSQHVCIIRPKADMVSARFLMYWLNSTATQDEINDIQKGATRQALTKKQIECFQLPAVPVSEQKELESVFEKIRLGEQISQTDFPDDLRGIVPQVVKVQAIATKLDEAKQLREEIQQELETLSTAVISTIVEEANFTGKLGDVLLGPPRNGWSAKCDGLDTGTRILSLGAVTGFWYRADQYKWTSEVTEPNAHYWLKPGDLLISRSNTLDLVGHAAIYDGMPSPCIYPDLLMLLRLDRERCDARFAHYVLQSRVVRDYIKAHAKGTSPTMKKISQRTVMGIPFPTACPRERQVEIANRLDTIRTKLQDAENNQLQAAKEFDAMLPAILGRAFRGEL